MTWPATPSKPPPPLLQSLTLRGFKSFADRARLEFDGGICAIIGPNGSGKSNVVEALRWVTHQARARELRTHKATELIFHGSGTQGSGTQGSGRQGGAGKAALGLAEVELELSLNAATLSLSRRIYRDGTTEQDLAGRPARVRDVQSALRGTGLGPGGLAVIGQGEVSTVVQATGAALLGYLQEAAGLSRSVAARQETEQRLLQASSSLHELALLSAQAQELTERLRLQAQAARQERAWQLEMLALQGAQARLRAQELEEEISHLRGAVIKLEEQSAALSAQILSHQAQLAAQREQALLAQAQQEAYGQRQRLLEAAQQQLQQQERYLQSLLGQRGQLEHDLAQLPAAAPGNVTTPSNVTAPGNATVPDPAPHQAALQRTRQQIADLEQQLQATQRQLRQAQATEQERREAQARHSAQQETWQRSLAQLEQQLQQRQAELQAAEQAQNHHHSQLAQAQQQLRQWQEQQQSRAQQRTEAQQSQATKRQSLEYVSREAARLGASLDSYERYGEGPRRALSSEHPGIIGSVADLLDVPAAYEVALQAALGRRLEQVVVATADDARSIIELLRARGGRATFLPLDLLRPRVRRDSALLRAVGVVGNLADLCPSDPPQVGEALLSDTLLLQDLESATALARRHATRPRLVTLTGDLLESGGAMTGGRTRDSGPNILSDQRRYHELQGELRLLQQQLAALESQLTALAPLPDPGLQAQVNALSEQQRRYEQQLAQAQAARDSTQQQLAQVQQQLEALLLQPPGPLSSPKASLPAVNLPEVLEQQATALEQQLTAARHQERHHSEQAQQAREQQLAWQQAARTEQQRQALQTRLQDLQHTLAAQQLATQQAQEEVQQRQTELAALPPQQNPQAGENLARQYSNLLAQQNTLRARLEETQLQVARREGARQPVPYGCLLAGTAREWQARIQYLRRALEELGVVNALAESELAQAQQRLTTLTGQQQDIAAAVSELQGHLEQMLSQEAQATQQAFERTRHAFIQYVGELLGGSGELQAEYTASNLSGLSLQVQPRGKRTRNLNLLSAGERTMAGLAFLFALGHAAQEQTGRFSLPLAVLDEVDAPLDEANIRRFTHFLKLFAARGTQFIVVTHQKATMEVAQTIWGVTTDQSGASRLLSIKQE